MTPLKPIENLRVRGVAAERYPPNKQCAHPECAEDATDNHHCFPRSQLGNDSWFAAIDVSVAELEENPSQYKGLTFVTAAGFDTATAIIPIVSGLCNFHHGLVEMHLAWIKLEDGQFVWYDLEQGVSAVSGKEELPEWERIGPLNPQPGSREGRPKRKKFSGEQRRQRKTISIKVPNDTEDGGAIWDEVLEEVKAKLIEQGLYSAGDNIPVYEAVVAALRDWLNG